MEPDLNQLNYYSRVNYMKRSDKSGQGNIFSDNVNIDHELGYVPQFLTYVDLFNDGMLWYGGECVYEGTGSTAAGPGAPPKVDSWCTDSTLTLYPLFVPSSRLAYWLIYLDYGG